MTCQNEWEISEMIEAGVKVNKTYITKLQSTGSLKHIKSRSKSEGETVGQMFQVKWSLLTARSQER